MSFRRRRDPCAASVMQRALILNAIYITGMMLPSGELLLTGLTGPSPDNKFGTTERSRQSSSLMVVDVKAAGLWPSVDVDEQKLLLSKRISEQQRIDASWLPESIASLLWALRMIPELPAYDREADPTLLSPLRMGSIPELIGQARLRRRREIEKQREIAELWHWRARTRRLQDSSYFTGQSVGGRTIEQIIAQLANESARAGRLPNPVANDFPAMGSAYQELSCADHEALTSIAQERHKAFNWLCGFSPTGRWADTPTDT